MGVGGWYQLGGVSPWLDALSSLYDVATMGGSSGASHACCVGSEFEMEGVGTHLASSWCCSCSWCCALTLALSSSSNSCWNSLSHLSCSSKSSLICSWLSPSRAAGESGLTKYKSVCGCASPTGG